MSQVFHLIDTAEYKASITQGATYQITFLYPEDVTTATPKGQIRRGYAQDNGEILAEFNFLTLQYDWECERTQITAELTAEQTVQIPYTKYTGVGNPKHPEPTIKNCFIYDMELEFPDGVVKKIVATSLVQVNPETTRYV